MKINSVNIFPNPASNYLTVNYSSAVAGKVKMTLMDVTGKEVAKLHDSQTMSGKHQIFIDLLPYSLGAGIYFLEMELNGKQEFSQKLILTN